MAEAIVSILLDQLTSITAEEIGKEVRLVVGVDKEVEKLRSNLQAIEAVVADAEQRQVKEKTTVRLWLDRLKHISNDIEDALDEWNYALLKQQIEGADESPVPNKNKVCFSLPCSCFSFKQVSFRHDIALKIKQINGKLVVIAQEKDRYNFNVIRGVENSERVQSTSFVNVPEIYGRVGDKRTLVQKLCESSEQCLPIISIIGMGGIGKTTLAQFAYKNNEVINNFDKIMWVCVSDYFDEYRIAKAIIEALESSTCDLGELQSLLERISRSIEGKKFLLILDDVWTEDYRKWEPLYHCLMNGRHGSKILVTTRKESIVRMMESVDIISVEKLSDDECWSLFRRLAFFGKSHECEKLEEIGKKISSKCKGLPLAAKTIGNLLRFKRTRQEWQSVLDSELWKLEEFEKEVFPALLLSYNDLPFMIKRCFTFCAIFPKDYKIYKDYVINLWMAHGYLKGDENKAMEVVGQEYFDYLASRSFFQEFLKDGDDFVIHCKMHDLVHDFAQFLSKNECLSIEGCVKQPFTNSSYREEVHHLMIVGDSFLDSICSLKRLRSFLYYYESSSSSSSSLPSDILPNLFGELTSLRALDIRRGALYMIEDVPKEIGKLIHLRYLNLSWQKIRTLPEALCGLYNLQTLDINCCEKLEELPRGIGRLINLRHLLNYGNHSLNYMPIGIQRLTCLRTLSEFHVSGGGGHDNKACSLEGLKSLNLFGFLSIRGLGNVSDVDEAERSELKNQNNLLRLALNFRKDEGERRNEDDEVLLEILRTPPNLDVLGLYNYRGNAISPDWMMSLTNLRELVLRKCENCKLLPPLGKLSSLKSLVIYQLKSVKRVSGEFLGIESDDGTSSSFIAFPKLESLVIWELNGLEEWDYEIKQNGEEEHITIMPSLVSLEICYCPKLKALPNHLVQNTTLKKSILECPMLENC